MKGFEKLLRAGDRYLRSMELRDMAALKFCLISMGVLLGIGLPKKGKRKAAVLASLLFVGTYAPLMGRFLDLYTREEVPDAGQICQEAHPED